MARQQDLLRVGDVVPGLRSGLCCLRLAQLADLSQRSRLRDDEIVRHQVGILEEELDRLAGSHDQPLLIEQHLIRHGGSVVNITSVSGITGMAGQTNYSASKAGVIGFTKALAREVARFGVRVNAVAPGFIDTDMTASIDENARKKLYAQIPLGKPGTSKQVARAVLYLTSEDASYITGQVLTMDGGLS